MALRLGCGRCVLYLLPSQLTKAQGRLLGACGARMPNGASPDSASLDFPITPGCPSLLCCRCFIAFARTKDRLVSQPGSASLSSPSSRSSVRSLILATRIRAGTTQSTGQFGWVRSLTRPRQMCPLNFRRSITASYSLMHPRRMHK